MTWQINNGSYRLGTEAVSSGRLTLSFPAIAQPHPPSFRQKLHLLDGTGSYYSGGPAGSASLVSFVAEGDDCLVVRCRHAGTGKHVLKLHLWPSCTQARFIQGAGFIAITEHADHQEDFLLWLRIWRWWSWRRAFKRRPPGRTIEPLRRRSPPAPPS